LGVFFNIDFSSGFRFTGGLEQQRSCTPKDYRFESVQETDIGRPNRYLEPRIMTYNFDPDKWYQIERAALDRQFKSGELIGAEYEKALDELEKRYSEMIDRLDGTYQLPK
jgi:hypothetical protein